MTLLADQTRFLAEIAADDDAPPSSLGMGIYRNAYRARLIGALESGYERTKRWVGDEAFEAAAAHYILTMPPSSWTLDAFGAQFPDVLAELFAGDGEVAELAWLEWHMQQAFAAPDLPELDAADLAAAGLANEDWAMLRFTMAAGFVTRPIHQNVAEIWREMGDAASGNVVVAEIESHELIIWRSVLQPRFRMLDKTEWAALGVLSRGGSFGEAAERATNPASLGSWLANWLNEGLLSGYGLPDRYHRSSAIRSS